ncbi:helix-turn-helix transcriptional regulator [Nocardia asteroides]|uniref:helix-turn-helix transcriptional regulator n=1 Tax=Nocardia asteroides TaxID=1824 RepID=UPI001E3796A9|nr:helix-turn-helix domain-containing protein [Nocardia asteroides]UGT60204.1 helix-turn-helix domain-containing protein [Nocardia asteroides]
MTAELGQLVKSVRKRRALTQQELADLSGVSLARIRQLETGGHQGVRLATLRKLAIALQVRTSVLQPGGSTDAEHASAATLDLWEPVRRALVAPRVEGEHPDEPVCTSAADLEAPMRTLAALEEACRYAEVAALLPSALVDAAALGDEGRGVRARLLRFTAWTLVQNRQFDTAALTVDRALDIADDPEIVVGAVQALVWSHLRQGNLDAARQLAEHWADEIEPKRFSRATPKELARWGKVYMHLANVAVRDNSPGAADDALSVARAAAARVGREIFFERLPVRTFGPVSVAHIAVETAVVTDQPTRALAIAESLPSAVPSGGSASRLRHRLDVANAHAQLRQWPEAMGTLAELRTAAPEWLTQQRYARDIVQTVVSERRTLTPDMRELADFVNLEY